MIKEISKDLSTKDKEGIVYTRSSSNLTGNLYNSPKVIGHRQKVYKGKSHCNPETLECANMPKLWKIQNGFT